MDSLVSILDSFQAGWRQKDYMNDLIGILKDVVIPTYPLLESSIENNTAVFSADWNRIATALKDARIMELLVPPEYGGRKVSEIDLYYLMELLGYSSPGLGIMFVSHGRAVDVILLGSEDQKRRFLPAMAEGRFGAIAMTEDQAGSDASAIGLQAVKEDGRYRLDGQKVFISNSGLAGVYAVLANTKGQRSARSLSVLLVENDTAGFAVQGLPEKDGLKVLPTGRLIFKDCLVSEDNLIGQEGNGLLLTMDVIDRGRIHIAGICCGLAFRIFRELYHYAQGRKQFDHPLTKSQDISFQIAEMYTRMSAARGLCFHALNQIGTPAYRISSSQAKLFASQMVMDVAARAQILMGGRGYFKSDLINQLSADARGMEYLEGTSNIQKMIIARELFRGYYREKGHINGL